MAGRIAYYGGIVKAGLVLDLDAAKKDSYASSGAIWNDISGNGNNGTLVNGPTFSNTNGGSLVFNGTNTTISNFPTQISNNGSKTISCFFRASTTSRMGLCGTRDASTNVGWTFTVNRTTAGNLTYFHTGGTTIEIAAGISINTWYNATITYDLSSSIAILYLNGSQIGSPSSGFSGINTSTFNGIIGGEQQSSVTELFNGSIAQVQIYNRALSASEISQNYNAQKSRYGL